MIRKNSSFLVFAENFRAVDDVYLPLDEVRSAVEGRAIVAPDRRSGARRGCAYSGAVAVTIDGRMRVLNIRPSPHPLPPPLPNNNLCNKITDRVTFQNNVHVLIVEQPMHACINQSWTEFYSSIYMINFQLHIN